MRPSFEENLKEYSRLIQDQLSAQDTDELEKLQTVVDYHLERAAKIQDTTTKTQEKVFEVQKEKQRIMKRLHDNVRCLDNPKCTPERPPESRLTTFDKKENKFFVSMPDGRKEPATLGDILTDGDWGLIYYLDPKTTPRTAHKKFFIESAKKELRDLLDEQIAISESKIGRPSGVAGILKHRRIIAQSVNWDKLPKDEGPLGTIRGHLAEVVVKNFFQQLYINELTPFRIVEADVYQDAQEKIDFIIHIEKYKRGVNVEADDKVKNIAIQFTIAKSPHKESKIDKIRHELITSGIVDDIVLVKFPIKDLIDYYQKWSEENMPPGGPFQYSPLGLRKDLFLKTLKESFKPTDEKSMEKLWKKIEPTLKVKDEGKKLADQENKKIK